MNNPQGNTVSEVGASTDDLIARLEQAAGPNFELERDISAIVYGMRIGVPKPYTCSIDAALTLLPEGCTWLCGCESDFTPVAQVRGHKFHTDEFAATPAIALCIAALKARKATGTTDTHRDSVNEQRAEVGGQDE